MSIDLSNAENMRYKLIPTIKRFHEDPSEIRCIVGPVGCYDAET